MFARFHAALVLALTATGAASPAAAQEKVAAFVIRNPTSIPIKYQVGVESPAIISGPLPVEWTDYVLPPGGVRVHAVPSHPDNGPPTVYVRFDYILTDTLITWKMYRVETDAVANPAAGRPYAFMIRDGGATLDLFIAPR